MPCTLLSFFWEWMLANTLDPSNRPNLWEFRTPEFSVDYSHMLITVQWPYLGRDGLACVFPSLPTSDRARNTEDAAAASFRRLTASAASAARCRRLSAAWRSCFNFSSIKSAASWQKDRIFIAWLQCCSTCSTRTHSTFYYVIRLYFMTRRSCTFFAWLPYLSLPARHLCK